MPRALHHFGWIILCGLEDPGVKLCRVFVRWSLGLFNRPQWAFYPLTRVGIILPGLRRYQLCKQITPSSKLKVGSCCIMENRGVVLETVQISIIYPAWLDVGMTWHNVELISLFEVHFVIAPINEKVHHVQPILSQHNINPSTNGTDVRSDRNWILPMLARTSEATPVETILSPLAIFKEE